jgi:hypothetical protein
MPVAGTSLAFWVARLLEISMDAYSVCVIRFSLPEKVRFEPATSRIHAFQST